MSDKKIVTFGAFTGWTATLNGSVAHLSDVRGHYRLGDEAWVRTSLVVRVKYQNDDQALGPVEIETLNTIYRRRES